MGYSQHEYQGNEHSIKSFNNPSGSEVSQNDEGIIARGERKFKEFKNKVPDSVKARSSDAVGWAKANPYKAATIGLLGIMSLRSSFVRRLGRMAITVGASALIKKKLDDADVKL